MVVIYVNDEKFNVCPVVFEKFLDDGNILFTKIDNSVPEINMNKYFDIPTKCFEYSLNIISSCSFPDEIMIIEKGWIDYILKLYQLFGIEFYDTLMKDIREIKNQLLS